MKLREWRELKGYPLRIVMEKLKRKSTAVIWKWERFGVKRYEIREELKRLSKNKINDFGASDEFIKLKQKE